MSPKNPAAVALGRKGGKARAQKMTAEQRRESARKAIEARWAKARALVDEITRRTKALERKNRAAQAKLAKQKNRPVTSQPAAPRRGGPASRKTDS